MPISMMLVVGPSWGKSWVADSVSTWKVMRKAFRCMSCQPVSQYQVAEAFGHLAHQTCCWGCREALVYLKGSKSHIVEVEEHIMNFDNEIMFSLKPAKCCTVLSFSFAYWCKASISVLSSGSLKKQVISKDGLGVTEYAVTINFLAHSHLF